VDGSAIKEERKKRDALRKKESEEEKRSKERINERLIHKRKRDK
jgi:hypothetical protein